MVDHQIRAGITVYEFANGIEINRRPAFPFSSLGWAFQQMADSLAANWAPKFTTLVERIRTANLLPEEMINEHEVNR